MAAFANEGINNISMDIPNIKIKSSIKKSVITLNFDVMFMPDDIIPDYNEVDTWVHENIKDKEITIEDATLQLLKYLDSTYKPFHTQVNTKVSDATHFPVIVTAES